MGFWVFMFINVLLLPMIMIIAGKYYSLRPPRNINWFSGYRTSQSMKNQDTWQFAHHYFGKLWFRYGLILLVLTIPYMLIWLKKEQKIIENASMIIVAIQMIPVILSIVKTEKALNKTFDENGNRRHI